MKRLGVFLAPLLVLAIAAVALAQTGGGYDLSWSSVVGGGGKSTGGNYSVQGAAGQPDVAGQPLRGAKWGLRGGQYGPPPGPSPTPTRRKTYLPLVRK